MILAIVPLALLILVLIIEPQILGWAMGAAAIIAILIFFWNMLKSMNPPKDS